MTPSRSKTTSPGTGGPARAIPLLGIVLLLIAFVIPTAPVLAASRDLPELWIHGVPMQPERLKAVNASGGRMFVDLRKLDGKGARAHLQRYVNLDVGICLTLRWIDPNDREAADIAPTPTERVEKTNLLMEILTSPESKAFGDRIWVQFFNEVTGGPGMIRAEDADTMFGWATETALRIRKEAPHVKLCGPALTALDVLEKDPRSLTRMGQQRRDGLLRSIAWSAEFADAIDLHLHMADGDSARAWIRLLRGLLDKQPGGKETKILSLEWSPARYQPQSNLEGAIDTLIDIYRAMAEADFPIAGYATYYPALNIGQIFHWQSVVTTKGTPNEPFFSTLKKIGAGEIDLGLPNVGGGGSGPDPGPGGGDGLSIDPQLWVTGGLGMPQLVAQVGAAGVHGTLELPGISRRSVVETLRDHARFNLGMALTLRWPDPADPVRFDTIPNRRFVRQKSVQLVQALGSRYATEIADRGRLWLQFGAEIAGEEGAWRQADVDQFFDISTELAGEVRKRIDGVRLVGPALTDTEVLSIPSPTGEDLERKQLLERAIEWSVKNTDAVDVRFRSTSAAEIEAAVARVREVMQRHPGGETMPIISLAWNVADPASQGEPSQLETEMESAWAKMMQAGVNLAAYGPLFPRPQDAHADENWVSLLSPQGAPVEPFHPIFLEMAAGLGQRPLEGASGDGTGQRPDSGGTGGDGNGGGGAGASSGEINDPGGRIVRSHRGRPGR